MSGNKSKVIIKQYEIKDAPTGESTRYMTEDGAIWKPIRNMPPTIGTGDIYGRLNIFIKGGCIYD